MAAAISRRNVLRAGVVGGALVWAVPAVQLLDPKHAFAASGSGGTPPPPPVTPPPTTPPPATPPPATPPPATPPPATGSGTTPPTTVQGESFNKNDPTGTGLTATGASVLATSTTATGAALPFTGPNLPVKAALEAGAGLVVGGAVLRTLAARRPAPAAAGAEVDPTQVPPTA